MIVILINVAKEVGASFREVSATFGIVCSDSSVMEEPSLFFSGFHVRSKKNIENKVCFHG